MGADEARTVRDLKGHQAVVLPMVGEFGGRIIDTAGDGILAEFPSVVNAVNCAVAVQSKMAERNAMIEQERRMQYRIGINIGEQQLKNIARPVRAYRVRLDRIAPITASALALPDKPSIAVLPFQNMSG